MAFSKYAVLAGRSRRKEYWIFTACNAVLVTLVALVSPTISDLIALVTLMPSIAVGVRRMHDVNKSGWYFLIPLYNLFLAWTDGTKGINKYGPDPKTASTLSQTVETNMDVGVKMSSREPRDGQELTTAWAHGQTTVTKPKEKVAVKAHSDMKYCGHCGIKNIKAAKFCASCGKPFPSGV